jgi:ribosomal-protein-alanine N-acetyltransferase
MIIETKNLRLIQCDTEILKEAISGNENLSKKLGVKVLDNWTEFGVGALEFSLGKLSENENESGWWTYFPIHKQDDRLIGSGGYQGKPTIEGTVEIGYEITSDYRSRGLATEMTMGLVENAFRNDNVKSIIAHTHGQENPSTKVLTKCGFDKIEEINDPDEGIIWKWELKRK